MCPSAQVRQTLKPCAEKRGHMKRSSAVITVFFSLLSILFLGLTFTFVEAVRYRSARAHCADLTAASNWSVFSGYENRLLEKFDLFGIDGSTSGTVPDPEDLSARLLSFLKENADVRGNISEKLPGLTFDPFQVTAESAKVTDYALLSDKNGEYFYQQAVDFMHETAWMDALGELSDSARSARKAKEAMDEYEEAKESADQQVRQLKNQTADAEKEKPPEEGTAEKVKNPLWKMITLRFKSPLTLVCGKKKISGKKVPGSRLLSKRHRHRGSLKLDKDRGGITDDLLFREYLADHFPDFKKAGKAKASSGLPLDYQLEYILCGSASDKKNLKKTVKRLILLREAYNYLYLQKDPGSLQQTSSLAALILGWTGNAALVESLRQLLVVYWAYGESLCDVRILMHGGKIPLIKSAADWHVPLEKLYDLEKLLKRADHVTGHGEDYSDYLRLLLNMQSVSTQKKRSLDLLELDLRQEPGMESFRADNCVIAMKDSCSFSVRPVFSAVPKAFLGVSYSGGSLKVDSGFAYN